MRKLIVFNQVTLDGYFSGMDGDISWAHRAQRDPEFDAFVETNAKSGGELVFGRVTYEMMKSFWPTPAAFEQFPVVAERMNNLPKLVFSRTLDNASWQNTKVVKGDIAAEMRKIKNEPGDDLVIMGSGSIVSQLTQAGLIDEYQMVLFPIVLGKGRTMFDGIGKRLNLEPTKTRTFSNGNVLLCYEPVGQGAPVNA